jgi:hypothetical protein
MQVVAVIVLAALIFIAASYYFRLGLMWWVACTFVFARSRIRLVAGDMLCAVGPPVSCHHSQARVSEP